MLEWVIESELVIMESTMNEIESILEQARLFFVQYSPADALKQAMPVALICLLVGVGLSVLGAKLARFSMSCGFTLLGGAIGVYFSRQTGFSPLVCGALGALMVGVIGYQTYRLWVGMAAAVVLSSLAVGAFGYSQIVPHVAEFQQVETVAALDGNTTFVLPSPQEQEAYRARTPAQWAGELWAFIAEKNIHLERNAKAVVLAAMVTGLCLGVIAVRTALILSTSIMGTFFVSTGMATLLTHSVPEAYQACAHNPALVGMGVGGFLVTSLIIQTMLTRNAPSSKSDSSKS